MMAHLAETGHCSLRSQLLVSVAQSNVESVVSDVIARKSHPALCFLFLQVTGYVLCCRVLACACRCFVVVFVCPLFRSPSCFVWRRRPGARTSRFSLAFVGVRRLWVRVLAVCSAGVLRGGACLPLQELERHGHRTACGSGAWWQRAHGVPRGSLGVACTVRRQQTVFRRGVAWRPSVACGSATHKRCHVLQVRCRVACVTCVAHVDVLAPLFALTCSFCCCCCVVDSSLALDFACAVPGVCSVCTKRARGWQYPTPPCLPLRNACCKPCLTPVTPRRARGCRLCPCRVSGAHRCCNCSRNRYATSGAGVRACCSLRGGAHADGLVRVPIQPFIEGVACAL